MNHKKRYEYDAQDIRLRHKSSLNAFGILWKGLTKEQKKALHDELSKATGIAISRSMFYEILIKMTPEEIGVRFPRMGEAMLQLTKKYVDTNIQNCEDFVERV